MAASAASTRGGAWGTGAQTILRADAPVFVPVGGPVTAAPMAPTPATYQQWPCVHFAFAPAPVACPVLATLPPAPPLNCSSHGISSSGSPSLPQAVAEMKIAEESDCQPDMSFLACRKMFLQCRAAMGLTSPPEELKSKYCLTDDGGMSAPPDAGSVLLRLAKGQLTLSQANSALEGASTNQRRRESGCPQPIGSAVPVAHGKQKSLGQVQGEEILKLIKNIHGCTDQGQAPAQAQCKRRGKGRGKRPRRGPAQDW